MDPKVGSAPGTERGGHEPLRKAQTVAAAQVRTAALAGTVYCQQPQLSLIALPLHGSVTLGKSL